jgi:hypothetical protein
VVGPADLGHSILVVQHDRDLVEVEAEQGLQLTDACHPGQVRLRIAAQPAGCGAGGGEQAQLLVVAQRPLGYAGPARRDPDAEQLLPCEVAVDGQLADA